MEELQSNVVIAVAEDRLFWHRTRSLMKYVVTKNNMNNIDIRYRVGAHSTHANSGIANSKVVTSDRGCSILSLLCGNFVTKVCECTHTHIYLLEMRSQVLIIRINLKLIGAASKTVNASMNFWNRIYVHQMLMHVCGRSTFDKT